MVGVRLWVSNHDPLTDGITACWTETVRGCTLWASPLPTPVSVLRRRRCLTLLAAAGAAAPTPIISAAARSVFTGLLWPIRAPGPSAACAPAAAVRGAYSYHRIPGTGAEHH